MRVILALIALLGTAEIVYGRTIVHIIPDGSVVVGDSDKISARVRFWKSELNISIFDENGGLLGLR